MFIIDRCIPPVELSAGAITEKKSPILRHDQESFFFQRWTNFTDGFYWGLDNLFNISFSQCFRNVVADEGSAMISLLHNAKFSQDWVEAFCARPFLDRLWDFISDRRRFCKLQKNNTATRTVKFLKFFNFALFFFRKKHF